MNKLFYLKLLYPHLKIFLLDFGKKLNLDRHILLKQFFPKYDIIFIKKKNYYFIGPFYNTNIGVI